MRGHAMRGHLSQHLDVAEQKLKAAQDAISELRKAIENLDIANDESVVGCVTNNSNLSLKNAI
jgi:hypothetical protein